MIGSAREREKKKADLTHLNSSQIRVYEFWEKLDMIGGNSGF